MSELFDKSLRTLELPRVLELLSEQAVSAEAKRRARGLRPETEPGEVLRLLDQTDAARNLIGLRGSPSFSGVKPVAEALDRADRGGGLNNRELLTIADLLTAARRCKEYFTAEAAEKTAIDHLFLSLHGNRFLEEKIKRCLPDEDTVADAASTELADIRRHMRAAQAKSRQILQRIISSPAYGKILQETIITQRDGRFVVPVKAEHKGDLPGLVHDISSTGATLFVEPMGVVQANNEYIELQAKEQKEIERILAELSAESVCEDPEIPEDGSEAIWADVLTPGDGCEVWATHRGEFYAGKAAVTFRRMGRGSVTYVGVSTGDGRLERRVLDKLYARLGSGVMNLPYGVTLEYRNGFGIVLNYSDRPYRFPLPEGSRVLIGSEELPTAGVLVFKVR